MIIHTNVVDNCRMSLRMITLMSVLLFFCGLSYSQKEADIYNRIYIDYIEKQKPPNVDYTSGITLTVLKRPNYMNKLDSSDFIRFNDKYDKLELSTFISYIKESQLDLNFERIDINGAKIILLENDSIPSWLELSSIYPNWIYSIIELSNIGFNDAKDQALVYYGFNSGPGVGGGFYMVFESKGKRWKCKKVIPSWAT
jgi:hypothetical protein